MTIQELNDFKKSVRKADKRKLKRLDCVPGGLQNFESITDLVNWSYYINSVLVHGK